ncbi:MAG: guanylate kinase [Planctomycetes bacterium]|nr:guanylate kinase [Planctomycetota bacterium]NBY03037.1 guanylate kinase [Planctomycetota bacterium]
MSNSTKQAFRGPLIIISGPSGSGKSTLVKELLKDKSMPLEGAISVTTRKMRPFEVDGVDYFFWDKMKFQDGVSKGSFLEWAEVYGNYYGTLISEVDARRTRGIGVVLEIDVQGAGQIRKTGAISKSIFVVPPDMNACEARLRSRGTETEETLAKRLASAKQEMEQAAEYDFKVVNDDLEKAVVKIKDLIRPLFIER